MGINIVDEKLASAGKDALVQVVKLAQKRRLEGDRGGWKEFLKVHDKKFGASVSDPAKRTPEDLLTFLRTFKKEEDLQYFANAIVRFTNHEQAKQFPKSEDAGCREQKLVNLTFEHPQYPIEYSFPSHEEDWIKTKLRKEFKKTRPNTLLAVDCEMVRCKDETEALVKICIVDRNLQVKLHEFVNPYKTVEDYRTEITGVSAKDLDGVTCSLKDLQNKLKKLLSRGTILIGHSLSNDLKAMKVDHERVIDTSFIFNYGDKSTKRRPSLNDLCKSVLGYELREKGAPHNCLDDACAAMKLVLAKIEHGIDDVALAAEADVPESQRAKLFLHRIPKDLPSEELHQHIPGDFTIEVQTNKNGPGRKYAAVATFKSPQEALDAYEALQGDERKDSSGLPQKLVSVHLTSGLEEKLYVRKMSRDNNQVSSKRSSSTETAGRASKKLKTREQINAASEESLCDDSVEEIKRLKELLSQRDQEITSLQKIVNALTRKQGL